MILRSLTSSDASDIFLLNVDLQQLEHLY